MPLTEQDILAARAARRPPEAGILQTLFDTLFPDPAQGMPAVPLMPGTLGGVSPSPRLGILQRMLSKFRGGQPGSAVPVSSMRPPAPRYSAASQIAKQGETDFMRQYLRLRYPETFPQAEGGRKLGDLMRATRPEGDIRMLQEGGYIKPLEQGRKLPEIDPGWIKDLIRGGQVP